MKKSKNKLRKAVEDYKKEVFKDDIKELACRILAGLWITLLIFQQAFIWAKIESCRPWLILTLVGWVIITSWSFKQFIIKD